MTTTINRCIDLLKRDQAIYYTGHHTGHVLTYAQGVVDSRTWADYINIGMEHGSFDMVGLAEYLRGLVDGGPTASGHRTPTVVVEAPVNGTDEANVRHNAWQFRQILGRGAHGIILCQAETAGAARAFVEACRYPIHLQGVDPAIPEPEARMHGANKNVRTPGGNFVGIGARGRGSEATAGLIWGIGEPEYQQRCDPWPLNPAGELMLGVKIESPEGVANCAAILAVPGLAYAELGPGDLGLSLGYLGEPPNPYPPAMAAAREKVFAACKANGLAFLEGCNAGNIAGRLDEGVRVIAGGREDTAVVGRAHSRR